MTSVTVIDPCLSTTILPVALNPMIVSIYDTVPQIQQYFAFDDQFALTMSTPGMCGPKTYTTNNALALISPPASGLVDSDFWDISTVTNNYADVGNYTVTLTVMMTNYPSVPAITVNYPLTVYDQCEVAMIDSLGQAISSLTFKDWLDPYPANTTFLPFTDDVATSYNNITICRDKVYTILEGYSFVTLTPPASGNNFIDPWMIAVNTSLLSDVGPYNATLQCSLLNYPNAVPLNVTFYITIKHPCNYTQLNLVPLSPMNFNVPTSAPSD
jgi:hypothetical protein